MHIIATITNDHITPLVMASIDMRYYANDDYKRDSQASKLLCDRRTFLTLHEMAMDKIALMEHAFNTIDVIDNRHI